MRKHCDRDDADMYPDFADAQSDGRTWAHIRTYPRPTVRLRIREIWIHICVVSVTMFPQARQEGDINSLIIEGRTIEIYMGLQSRPNWTMQRGKGRKVPRERLKQAYSTV